MTVYFDTSAVVKLMLEEPGADIASELWERASWRMVSQLVYPEARAALAAADRAGRVDRPTAARARERLELISEKVNVIDADVALARRAGDFAELHALRGYDAVHLACAEGLDAPRVVVATWDRELGLAAVANGLAVVPDQRVADVAGPVVA